MTKSEKNNALTAEQLCAAFILDAPVPIRHLFGLYGQRSTFASWKAKGLDVKTVPGMGPTVLPSEFKAFLLRLRAGVAPRIQPERTGGRKLQQAEDQQMEIGETASNVEHTP